jgi:hypothetical protein
LAIGGVDWWKKGVQKSRVTVPLRQNKIFTQSIIIDPFKDKVTRHNLCSCLLWGRHSDSATWYSTHTSLVLLQQ